MTFDFVCTPPAIAVAMIESVNSDCVSVIADFAAGDGALLREAEQRWPEAQFVASDVDPRRVRELGRHIRWRSGKADFLRKKSRERTLALRGLQGTVDLVLLNPPFTARGNSRVKVELDDDVVLNCSRGMAFVLISLQYLRAGGTLVAVVPNGSKASERDAAAWAYLDSRCSLREVQENHRQAFKGATVGTRIIRLTLRQAGHSKDASSTASPAHALRRRRSLGPALPLVRGRLPVHRAHESIGEVPLIHSTSLREGAVGEPRAWVAHPADLTGPALLIPRVGRVTPGKLSLAPDANYVLSDCVFGLPTRTAEEAGRLRATIIGDWDNFEATYAGTGAPFITVARLRRYLLGLGIPTEVRRTHARTEPYGSQEAAG